MMFLAWKLRISFLFQLFPFRYRSFFRYSYSSSFLLQFLFFSYNSSFFVTTLPFRYSSSFSLQVFLFVTALPFRYSSSISLQMIYVYLHNKEIQIIYLIYIQLFDVVCVHITTRTISRDSEFDTSDRAFLTWVPAIQPLEFSHSPCTH